MTNKEKSAKVVSEIVDIFRCPICHRSMKVVDFKSLICSNNHTFDFAKQGYVNMLTRPPINIMIKIYLKLDKNNYGK